ncbi:tetratricopeptide repeat protein [Pirellulales bacterium]|nr:tetratricopeptide repeat protein [Pirellulales bacterium]
MSQAPRTAETEESIDRYLAGWTATMQLLREGKSFSGRERNCVFINQGNQRFSDVSSITGLDFPDDGRGMVAVDWDHDGDLDLWYSNRTGPRLRWMRNNSDAKARRFVQVKLQGTSCNRDAIGARVELVYSDPTVGKSIQTLHAGDGYLSQGSKWLHFGVPPAADIKMLIVRWPDGAREQFQNIQAGGRVLLKQATGVAEPAPQRGDQVRLQPTKPQPHELPPTARTVLVSRPPAPLLQFYDANGANASIDFGQRPVLVNLWQASCRSCLREIRHWSQEHEALDALGLDVVLLSVDRLGSESDEKPQLSGEKPRLLEDLPASFRSGYANNALVDKLNILRRVAGYQSSRLAVPMSFLFDQSGGLAVLYRGPITASELRDDVRRFGLTSRTAREDAVPFAGRWTTTPRNLLLRPIADLFLEHGYPDDYSRIRQLEVARLAQQRALAKSEEEQRDIDTRFAHECFGIARVLQARKQLKQSIEYYRAGLSVVSEDATAHYYLALAFDEDGQYERALEHLRQCLQYQPGFTNAGLKLASILREHQQNEEAVALLRRTIQAEPGSPEAHFQLGMALAGDGYFQEALQSFLHVLELRPHHREGLVNAAALMARLGRYSGALEHYERVLREPPRQVEVLLGYGGILLKLDQTARAAEVFEEVVQRRPDSAPGHLALARALLQDGQVAAAAEHLESAGRIDPRNPTPMLRLAWLRATAQDPAARNGKQALYIAEQLRGLAQGKHPIVWDTLSAAHAELGDFDAAIAAAERAIEILGDGNEELADQIRARIRGYQEGVAYRE